VPRSRQRVVVTIGASRRRFICHICESQTFTGLRVKLNTAVAYRIGDQFGEDAISLVCADCRYVHTFVEGAVQLWDEQAGYPETPGRP
jgi:RNase P subunit RPR2